MEPLCCCRGNEDRLDVFVGLLCSPPPSSGEQAEHFSGRADALISALISKDDSNGARRPFLLPAGPWLATHGAVARTSVSWQPLRQALMRSDGPRPPHPHQLASVIIITSGGAAMSGGKFTLLGNEADLHPADESQVLSPPPPSTTNPQPLW